jgi:hypothetical protein
VVLVTIFSAYDAKFSNKQKFNNTHQIQLSETCPEYYALDFGFLKKDYTVETIPNKI